MKKPPHNSGRVAGDRDRTDSTFTNPDAPSGPGPEPSLAMRMARADMEDAFETGAPPFDVDTRPEETTQPTAAGRSMRIESRLVEPGGRVDAVGATYGRGDRAGAAAPGMPVQSVGAAMTTPGLPELRATLPDPDPAQSSDSPERDDPAEADRD